MRTICWCRWGEHNKEKVANRLRKVEIKNARNKRKDGIEKRQMYFKGMLAFIESRKRRGKLYLHLYENLYRNKITFPAIEML